MNQLSNSKNRVMSSGVGGGGGDGVGGMRGGGGGGDGGGGGGFQIVMCKHTLLHFLSSTAHVLRHPCLCLYFSQLGGIREQGMEQ